MDNWTAFRSLLDETSEALQILTELNYSEEYKAKGLAQDARVRGWVTARLPDADVPAIATFLISMVGVHTRGGNVSDTIMQLRIGGVPFGTVPTLVKHINRALKMEDRALEELFEAFRKEFL